MTRIAVLVSGYGSNLQAILDAIEDDKLPGVKIALVVSNRKEAYGIQRAIKYGIPIIYFPLSPYTAGGCSREEYDKDLAAILNAFNISWVVMAGWMHVLGEAFLHHFPSRVINLHPALPGAFPGTHAIERAYQAFQRGEISHTGIMVHLVPDPAVDAGPVIRQEIIPILANDSLDDLEARVHAVEHRLLVQAMHDLLVNDLAI
ncbi:MAG: phosphoribosylglycinamide formyltransferase [Anaerolineales bacterium]|nr:phosphoribosylglycinamide formyltransferase [Anaerolineales bacterium]